MFLGQSSATDSDGIVDPSLVECDRIHLSLNDEHLTRLRDRLFREMQTIQDRALVEYTRRWRVEILGQCIGEYSSGESHRMTHRIGDREGDTTIELVSRLRDEES